MLLENIFLRAGAEANNLVVSRSLSFRILDVVSLSLCFLVSYRAPGTPAVSSLTVEDNHLLCAFSTFALVVCTPDRRFRFGQLLLSDLPRDLTLEALHVPEAASTNGQDAMVALRPTCLAHHSPWAPTNEHKCIRQEGTSACLQGRGKWQAGAMAYYASSASGLAVRRSGDAHCFRTEKTTKSSILILLRSDSYAMAKAVP